MGFIPSKAYYDLWMRKKGDHYEYIATWVDDLLVFSKKPMEIIKKIRNSKFFKLFSNLYILTSLVFFIWIFFIDSNSILVNLKLKKEINELNERKLLLEKQIEIDKKIISNLKNPDSLEKYAREELYMKKDNEDIYIIEFKE